MKSKNVIVLLIITNVILLGIISNLIIRDATIGKYKRVIKEMDKTTDVTELNKTIEELNASHTEYANNIQTAKQKIANAITNEGVITLSDDTFETMSANIENIFNERTKLDESIAATAEEIVEGKKAYVNGGLVTGTLSSTKGILYYLGEVNTTTTFDISTIPGYQKLTLDNFIGNASATHCKYRNDINEESSTKTVSTSMSYDSSTGVLTITCPENSTTGSGVDYSRLKTIKIKVYLYMGEIENF